MAWLVAYANLSEEQIKAVQAPVTPHRFIMGAPGSGKSLVLVHRAASLRNRCKTVPSRYRILVFTNVLKDYIRTACLQLGIEDECISTFDHWCREYHEEHIGQTRWDSKSSRPDYSATRRAVLEHARGRERKLLDFVLVDEGQDLDASAFETLTAVADHVTVCADYKQQIYDGGATEPDIAARLGLRGANINLLSAFRCSPALVPLAAEFVDDAEERRMFVEQSRTWSGSTERPLLYLAPDFDAERERLVEMVRERMIATERIVILLPLRRQVAGFARALTEFGIKAESQTANQRNSLRKIDFNSPNPKVMTYHSAKGLTFDSVLMPRLVEDSFANASSANLKRLMFVGLTRATNWAYLSCVRSQQLGLLDDLNRDDKRGIIEIQTGAHPAATEKTASDAGGVVTIDDLL